MQGLKSNIGERGSLLEWRWTPFFALLTFALVVSLLTALAVPSTPLELFKQADNTSALLRRGSGITAQTGFGTESATGAAASPSDDESALPRANPRRGSLTKLSERNQAAAARTSRTESRIAEPFVRSDPPSPPEPEQVGPQEREEEAADEEEEEEEEAEEAPEAAGTAPSADAGGEEPTQDINPERPALLNPNVLRTLPAMRR